jgi:hypothetical protein
LHDAVDVAFFALILMWRFFKIDMGRGNIPQQKIPQQKQQDPLFTLPIKTLHALYQSKLPIKSICIM